MKRGHVSGGKDVWIVAAQSCIHEDAVIHLQASLLGQLDVGYDAYAGHDTIRRNLVSSSALGIACSEDALIAALVHAFDLLARPYFDVLLPIVVVEEAREVGREDASADPRFGEEQGDFLAVHGQSSSNLGANEAAADDCEVLSLLRQHPQALVIIKGAKVDDVIAAEG